VEIFIPNNTYLEGGKGFSTRRQDGKLSKLYRSSGDADNYPFVTTITSATSDRMTAAVDADFKGGMDNNNAIEINSSTNKPDMNMNTTIGQESNETTRPSTTTEDTRQQESSTKPITYSNQQEEDIEMSISEPQHQQQIGYNSVQVVTGANFSGKSVYLKQIALIVYMAHVGR
jgi:hypothetical protein